MTKLTLIDGNNWLRRKYEETRLTSLLRSIVSDLRTELSSPNTTLLIWDGFRGNDYRRAIYAPYKVGRATAPDNFYENVKLAKKLAQHLPITTIEVPYYEADDVIATICLMMKDKVEKIHVKSTDKDFEQLPNVSHEGKYLDIPSDQILLFKTLVGDKSDKITGIPNFGEKKWDVMDKDQAKVWMDKDFDPEAMPELPKSITEWATNNVEQLIAMRDVASFRPMTEDQITSRATRGVDDPKAIEDILKEHLA